MLYPNNIKKKQQNKLDNHANRGIDLENLIEEANAYYRENDIAYIYKKPTPIGVVKVKYNKRGKKIEDAYFKMPSTLDFNGLYKGRYIEFDAKVTNLKTSFPLSNIHDHQLEHIKNIYRHKGIVFLIIMINAKYYILMGKDIIEFISNETRKSIPYDYILEKGYEVTYNYAKGLDYLKIIDLFLGDDGFEETN